MKYLKSYKVFEADGPLEPGKWSWEKELTIPREMQLEIHDMSWELRDEGYSVSYQWWPPYQPHNKLYNTNKYPSINITKWGDDGQEKVYYGHIKDFCERIVSYLDEMGYNAVVKFRKQNTNEYYEISDSNVNWGPFKDYPMAYSIHFKIEMISRKVYGDVYESQDFMKIKYSEDVLNECDSIIADIKDMLLELTDAGLFTSVGYTPMTLAYQEKTPKIAVEISTYVGTWGGGKFLKGDTDYTQEVRETIERIKEYVKSKGYLMGDGEWESNNRKIYQMLIQK